jgi:2,3-bisphosphoglycerate-independent phosphoglycerate mutase
MPKIIMVVFSGLGGVQSGPNMLTELQQAYVPNMDNLMRRSVSGLLWPYPKGAVVEPDDAWFSLMGFKPDQKPFLNFKDATGLIGCVIAENGVDSSAFEKMGFDVVKCGSYKDMIEQMVKNYSHYDFITLVIHKTELHGMSGDYYLKVIALEQFDKQLGKIRELEPDVLAITGDCSIPTELMERTWHPVPVLLSSDFCRYDDVMQFDEINCRNGGLGHLYSWELMPIVLANGGIAQSSKR